MATAVSPRRPLRVSRDVVDLLVELSPKNGESVRRMATRADDDFFLYLAGVRSDYSVDLSPRKFADMLRAGRVDEAIRQVEIYEKLGNPWDPG